MDHPGLWRFIDGLRKVQYSRDVLYERFVAGQQPEAKRCKCAAADERILKIVSEYAERPPLQYLRGIAQNFRMQASKRGLMNPRYIVQNLRIEANVDVTDQESDSGSFEEATE